MMRHSHIACHAAALSWMLNRKLESALGKEALTTTKPTGCAVARNVIGQYDSMQLLPQFRTREI